MIRSNIQLTDVEIPLFDNLISTDISLNTNSPSNNDILPLYETIDVIPNMTPGSGSVFNGPLPKITSLDELLKYLSEIMIRFNTNPNYYVQDDFSLLIKTLSNSLIFLYENNTANVGTQSVSFVGIAKLNTNPFTDASALNNEFPGIYLAQDIGNYPIFGINITNDDLYNNLVLLIPKITNNIFIEYQKNIYKLNISSGFIASSIAPNNVYEGLNWLDLTTGIEYTWVTDEDTSQWVELSGNTGNGIQSTIGTLTELTTISDNTEIIASDNSILKWFSGLRIYTYLKSKFDSDYQPAGNYATTTELDNKVDKKVGKGLSTNDYTTDDKNKLAAIIGTNTGDQYLGDLQPKTDASLETDSTTIVGAINEVNSVAKGANKALSFTDYQEVISKMSVEGLNIGQNLYIGKLNIPDLWIKTVEVTNVPYTYISDTQFVTDILSGTQIGYYRLSVLETQKVDLTSYYTKNEIDTNFRNETQDTIGALIETTELTEVSDTTKIAASDNAFLKYVKGTTIYTYLKSKFDSDYQPVLTFSTDIEADKTSTTKVSAVKTMYDFFVNLSQTTSQTIGSASNRLTNMFASIVNASRIDSKGYIYTNTSNDTSDSINDRREIVISGVKHFERCTVANASKGGGTWVVDATIDSSGILNLSSNGAQVYVSRDSQNYYAFIGERTGTGPGKIKIYISSGGGLSYYADNDIEYYPSNTRICQFNSNGIYIVDGKRIIFNNEVGFFKNNSTTIEINNGTVGQYRDLILRNLNTTGYNYFAVSAIADTVNDVRTSVVSGAEIKEICTVANATKGSGTWVKIAEISNNSKFGTTIDYVQNDANGIRLVGNANKITLADGTTALTVLNNGNVGIGTTAPTANLQVAQGTVGTGTVTTAGTTALVGSGTQFTNTFKVGDTITVSGETGRTISTITDNTHLTVSVAFSTSASGLTYTLVGGTIFSVLGNGNVGIGTTNPGYPLVVSGKGTATPYGNIQLSVTSTANEAGFNVNNTGTGGRQFTFLSTNNGSGAGGGKFILADATSSTARIVIDSSGNFGIGTTTPTDKLQVNGSSLATTAKGGTTTDYVQNDANGIKLVGTANVIKPDVNATNGMRFTDKDSNDIMVVDSVNKRVIIGNGEDASRLRVPSGRVSNSATNYVTLEIGSQSGGLNGIGGANGNTLEFYNSGYNVLSLIGSSEASKFIIKQQSGTLRLISGNNVANTSFTIEADGSGKIIFRTNANNGSLSQAQVSHTANAVNYLDFTGGASGNSVKISALGSDTNIPISLIPKGSGNILINTATDNGTDKLQVSGSSLVTTAKGGTATDYVQNDANGVHLFGSANRFFLSSFPTAPSSATDTGTTGEVRITAAYIYVCTATNTWVRTPLTTW